MSGYLKGEKNTMEAIFETLANGLVEILNFIANLDLKALNTDVLAEYAQYIGPLVSSLLGAIIK